MRPYRLVGASLLAVLLAACSNPTIPDPEPTSDDNRGPGSSASTGEWEDIGMGEGEEFGDDRDSSDGELAMIVYFDFDESTLSPEYSDLLAQHANRLANDARLSVRLEGHADERGSREYNIGLGERRSQAVRRQLLIQGAAANQISTVSFGEERPAAFGSDEESYALNRRVELKYLN